jgi:ElaB/YqjD/DUF883 family membrane-anchored ribosome-binding protein
MPANAVDTAAKDAKAAASSVAEAASEIASQAERTFADAAKRFEKIVSEGVEQIRAQSRTYADTTVEHLDEAQRYVVERVREKPLMAAGTALGVGLLIGLLLASGRNR